MMERRDARIIEVFLAAILAVGISFGAWIGISIVDIRQQVTLNSERIAQISERLSRVEATLNILVAEANQSK